VKEVLSVFLFGIGALCFVVFFANLRPDCLAAAAGPNKPTHCSTKASATFGCRSLVVAAALWPPFEHR
jgi:hypothetical protein